MMFNLYERKVQSVFVEGGSFLLKALISAGIWDEARVFECPVLFKEGIAAPKLEALLEEEIQLKTDVLKIYRN